MIKRSRPRCNSFCINSSSRLEPSSASIGTRKSSKDDLTILSSGATVPRCLLKPAISLQNMSEDEATVSLKTVSRLRLLEKSNRGLYTWITQSNILRAAKILCIADQETFMLCFLEPVIGVHGSTDSALKVVCQALDNIARNPFEQQQGTRERQDSIGSVSSSTIKNPSSTDSAMDDVDEFLYSPRHYGDTQLLPTPQTKKKKSGKWSSAVVKARSRGPCVII